MVCASGVCFVILYAAQYPCGLFEGVAVLGCSMVSLVTRVPALYLGMTMLCILKGLSQYEER